MPKEYYSYITVSISALIAVIFVWLRYYPLCKKLLIPYYKPHDISKIGFIKFSETIKLLSSYRYVFFFNVLFPLGATIYLFSQILLDFIFPSTVNISTEYFYFFIFAFGFSILNWWNIFQSIIKIVLLIVAPFLAGQYIFDSIVGGYIGVALVLSTAIAFFLKDSIESVFFQKTVEGSSKKDLTGENLSRIANWIKFPFLFQLLSVLILPAIMIYTVYSMAAKNFAINSISNFDYHTFNHTTLIMAAPLLLVYLNVTILGMRGIMRFVQRDLFHALDNMITLKRLNEKKFIEYENAVDEVMPKNNTKDWSLNMPSEARIQNPKLINFTSFYYLLLFFVLDGLLTFSVVLGINLLPGLSIVETGAVLSVFKIIFYSAYIYHALKILLFWISGSSASNRLSVLKQFHFHVQAQQINSAPYIKESRMLQYQNENKAIASGKTKQFFPKGIIGLNIPIAAFIGYKAFGIFGVIIGVVAGGIVFSMLYVLLTPRKIIQNSENQSKTRVQVSAFVLLAATLASFKLNTNLHGDVLLGFQDYFAALVMGILIVLTLFRFIQANNVVEDFYTTEKTDVAKGVAVLINILLLLWFYFYFIFL